MTNIEKFESEELDLLASLPYRVGRYVSDADDEEGGHDDEQEESALEDILKAFAAGEKGSPFTQQVAQLTLDRRGEWSGWKYRIFDITEDCGKAVEIVEKRLGKTKAKNFRKALLVVARKVAKAADEFDDFNPEDDDETGGLGAFVSKFAGKLTGRESAARRREEAHLANVSPAEKSAIDKLAAAMHIED